MSRIAERFAATKARGERALIAYIAAGDPSLEATAALVKGMEAAGVDMIELGLPFSDPVADGPTIQEGSLRAMAAGANTDNVLAMIQSLREDGVKLPLLIMTYYNLIFRPGVENFCRRAREAGVDGLIVPDVPMEEADELLAATKANGLDLVQFVAPTSPPERIQRAAEMAGGFVYCLSVAGVTGARKSLPPRFKDMVESVKNYTSTPTAVGFGISTPEHVRMVASIADGVIVGSAIVRLCGLGLPQDELVERVSSFVRELKSATRISELAG